MLLVAVVVVEIQEMAIVERLKYLLPSLLPLMVHVHTL